MWVSATRHRKSNEATLHLAPWFPQRMSEGTRMPCSFKNSWPGFSFHLLFERRKSWGGKTEGERGKKRTGLLGKTMTLKKLKPVLKAAEECDLSRETQASNGTVPLQQANTDHAKMHCQRMWSLQVGLRLPTPQCWHGDTILDCAGGSSQSKRSLKIEGG